MDTLTFFVLLELWKICRFRNILVFFFSVSLVDGALLACAISVPMRFHERKQTSILSSATSLITGALPRRQSVMQLPPINISMLLCFVLFLQIVFVGAFSAVLLCDSCLTWKPSQAHTTPPTSSMVDLLTYHANGKIVINYIVGHCKVHFRLRF